MSDKLERIYETINSLDDEVPAQLAKKIKLYSYALRLIGSYHASSINAHGQSYACRKRIWGETIRCTQGTAKDKEAAAEVACYEARMSESKADAERQQWKDTFQATTEIINALKVDLKVLMKEYGDNG
jgi:hypothetical protein